MSSGLLILPHRCASHKPAVAGKPGPSVPLLTDERGGPKVASKDISSISGG